MNKDFIRKYGPWALVTGASAGIGREVAVKLAKRGLNIILQGRNETALAKAKQEIEESGAEAEFFKADLAVDKEIDDMLAFCQDMDVGLFVGAAGVGTSGEFVENAIEEELNMLDLNCGAMTKITHHFAKKFVKQKHGGIMLFGSIVGFQGTPYTSNYAATKAYMLALGEGLYYELKNHGVDVLTVSPGPVATNFIKRARMKMDIADSPKAVAEDIVNALGKKMTCKPGWIGKFLHCVMAILPRCIRVKVMSIVMGKMTQ